ncbi:hypothetical protein LTR56_028232, partial [Elasticomyces elasticus]
VLQGIEYINSAFKQSHTAVNERNILLNRTGQVKLANVGDCVLRSTANKPGDDLQSFADVLVHMFLPLQPVEANLQRSLDDTAYDFFTYVRANELMAALQ